MPFILSDNAVRGGTDGAGATTFGCAGAAAVRREGRHEAIQAMRKRQDTPEWRALYGACAGIEGCLSQGVRLCGLRRSRYLGLAKTHLQHVATAAALNVARLDAWLRGRPRAATRISRFVQLMAA